MNMDTSSAIAMRIVELCRERGITIHKLSYLSGVPDSTLRGIIYQRGKNPGVITIKKLCNGLDITVTEFFNTDIFRNLEQEME